MTIKQVADQLYERSHGTFGGRHVPKPVREENLKLLFSQSTGCVTLEMKYITLADGNWYFYVSRYADTPDGYDYMIPDTREQEDEWRKRFEADGPLPELEQPRLCPHELARKGTVSPDR